jgi:hypothetical protein
MQSTGNNVLDGMIRNEIASQPSLDSVHQVVAEWNYNAYTEMDSIGCFLTNALNSTSFDEGMQLATYTFDASNIVKEKDLQRLKHTPLRDIFGINRPNPGIVHSVFTKNSYDNKVPLNGDADPLTISRVFNMIAEDTRLYPMSNNSPYKYWNSARKIDGVLSGVSGSGGAITCAAPFIKYKTNISINKVTVKTQKHLGYPLAYRVDTFDGTSWSTAYEATGTALSISSSSYSDGYHTLNFASAHGIKALDDIKLSFNNKIYTVYTIPTSTSLVFYTGTTLGTITGTATVSNMADGILNVYYDPANGGSWGRFTPFLYSPDEKVVTDFSTTNTQTKTIRGLRFVVTKMSVANIPLEVIELSPRLTADITNNIIGFDVNSSMGQSAYGLPIGAVISSSGSLKVSNTERYFNKNNSGSILKDILKPNVQIKLYQKMTIQNINYRFPLKVLYTDMWNEVNDFTVETQLEDYFKFFKEMSAPDLMIANQSGVPTSVAILMLLDNIGFSGYKFQKTSTAADSEDFILDFFYSKKEQTVMEVLESLAVSTQTSIYIDYDSYVDNELIAMTKERMIQSKENKDFWLFGDDGTLTRSVDFIGGSPISVDFISNISSFQENSEPPITDINIKYNGVGLEKKSFQLMGSTDEQKKNILEGPTGGASVANRDLRYTTDIVWKPSTDPGNAENYLAAAGLIASMSETRPLSLFSPNPGTIVTKTAINKYEAVKLFFADNPTNMAIYLDKELINTFQNTYAGYLLVDQELIRYEGIRFTIFDPAIKMAQKKILFSKEEYLYERSRLRQGGSIEPEALIVYLEMKEIPQTLPNKTYTILSDGRGQKNTKIVFHKGVSTSKPFLTTNPGWTKFGGQLYGTTISSSIVNGLTASNIVNTGISNQTVNQRGNVKSMMGYLKVSAPKSSISQQAVSSISEDASVKRNLPMNSVSEQIITGVVRDVRVDGQSIPIRKIGTRMRLVSDVPKNVNPGENLIKDGVIAGIGWNINSVVASGTNKFSGYVVEIEEVGTIDAASILDAKYRNLRFYRVNTNGKVKFFDNAWVNVSGTPNERLDFGSALSDARSGGKSYAQVFDLEVIIRKSKNGTRTYYEVYWEGQLVIETNELTSDILTEVSNVALLSRGPSSAIYEYVYAFSSPDDEIVKSSGSFATKNMNVSVSDLAARGLLPEAVKQGTDLNVSTGFKGIFDDFGKMAREAKKFDVRYQYPSLNPTIISLANYNPSYYVSDFNTSSFGSSFWLYNTSNGPIQIDSSTYTPVYVSAYALKEIMGGTLQSSKYLEIAKEDKVLNDVFDINRQTYGKQEISLSGEYINNLNQARTLADWIISSLSKERKTIAIGLFPNPLLDLGDRIGIRYSDKLYTDDNKSYTITSISHSITQAGPQMNIEVKECI